MSNKKPSDFCQQHPYDSVLQNSECETIARNIMVILKNDSDVFKELSLSKYRKETSAFSHNTERDFEYVVKYTTTAKAASTFSRAWLKIYEN